MHILKNLTAPNGARTVAHQVFRIELEAAGGRAVVNSFLDDGLSQMAWQDNYPVPFAAVSAIEGDTLDGFYEWLVANEGPFLGGTFVPDAIADVEMARRRRWAAVKAARDRLIAAGAEVPGVGRFDIDLESRANLTGAVTGALIAQGAGQPFAINWKLADNTIVQLDGKAMIAAGVAILQRVSAIHAHSQQLGIAIRDAADAQEIEAIDLAEGWPE